MAVTQNYLQGPSCSSSIICHCLPCSFHCSLYVSQRFLPSSFSSSRLRCSAVRVRMDAKTVRIAAPQSWVMLGNVTGSCILCSSLDSSWIMLRRLLANREKVLLRSSVLNSSSLLVAAFYPSIAKPRYQCPVSWA
ncbi:uncharacterized protein EpC_32070 [Erwinia pyrifoliae Ep1/96]|nr:uncharacterized protein EpC_32070 [Erwinia pyrifoliae Ep1/96]